MVCLPLHLDEECATAVTEEQHAEGSHQVKSCYSQCMRTCRHCVALDRQQVALNCMYLHSLAELLLQF